MAALGLNMVTPRKPSDQGWAATVATVTVILSALVLFIYGRSASQERAHAAESASINALMAERQAVSLDIEDIEAALVEGRNSLETAVLRMEQRLAQTSWYPYSELRERSRELQPSMTERAFLATVLVRKALAQLANSPERAESFLRQAAKEYESLFGRAMSIELLCAEQAENETDMARRATLEEWLKR